MVIVIKIQNCQTQGPNKRQFRRALLIEKKTSTNFRSGYTLKIISKTQRQISIEIENLYAWIENSIFRCLRSNWLFTSLHCECEKPKMKANEFINSTGIIDFNIRTYYQKWISNETKLSTGWHISSNEIIILGKQSCVFHLKLCRANYYDTTSGLKWAFNRKQSAFYWKY